MKEKFDQQKKRDPLKGVHTKTWEEKVELELWAATISISHESVYYSTDFVYEW